ncbi:MAG: hypothetical protein R2860_06475 [Desulfobacterales bacterium]
MAEEAGARITDFDGNPYELTKNRYWPPTAIFTMICDLL